ncbi:MAG: DNA repair protein RadC [Candidatus Omnitrophota bacterium]
MSKNNLKQKIKDLPKIERPREKLIRYGAEKLSNSELLAILLRTGKSGENVVNMANRILKNFKSENLPEASFSALSKFNGLGPAKACEIIACFELGKRLLKGKKAVLCMSAAQVWEESRNIRDNKKEHFVVFYLDARNQVIKRELISIGILNSNLVHPREVFEPAIKNSAAHIIFVHNHPSGSLEPSREDIAVTKRLVEAGKILGIEVLDHVIVGSEGYFSFKDKDLL